MIKSPFIKALRSVFDLPSPRKLNHSSGLNDEQFALAITFAWPKSGLMMLLPSGNFPASWAHLRRRHSNSCEISLASRYKIITDTDGHTKEQIEKANILAEVSNTDKIQTMYK